MTNEMPYLENDEYQTNVLYKSKKVHIPYKYLKNNYPEIKFEKIYDFILKAIQFIQDYYKLKRKPFTKYVPHLYNFYQENIPNVPIINHFQNNYLILEQEIIDKLYELLNIKTNIISNYIKSTNITKKPVNDDEISNKYYYFNKSKNQYFKKLDIVNSIIVTKLVILKIVIKTIAKNIPIITESILMINQQS